MKPIHLEASTLAAPGLSRQHPARFWPITHARILIMLCAALLLLADALALAHTFRGNPYWRNSIDFSIYTRAAAGFAHGQNPYILSFYEHGSGHSPLFYGVSSDYDLYQYPPLLAEFLWPVVAISDTLARYAWLVLSVGALAGSVTLLLRSFGIRLAWHWIALIVGVTGATYTVRNDLYHGQVNFVLLFLLTLGLLALQRGKPVATGVLWGLMFTVKPFLGVLLLYLFWRRQWRAAIASVVSSGTLLLLSFVPTFQHGTVVWQSWMAISRVHTSGSTVATRPDNMAIHGLLLRLFSDNPFVNPITRNSFVLAASELLVLSLVMGLLIAALGRPLRASIDKDPLILLVEVGCMLGLSMAFGPLTEGDHLLLLIPGLIGVLILTHKRLTSNVVSTRIWLWAAAAWVLLFVLRASPWRLGIGIADGESWRHLNGISILLTGQFGLLLLAASALMAGAMWLDQQTGESIQRGL